MWLQFILKYSIKEYLDNLEYEYELFKNKAAQINNLTFSLTHYILSDDCSIYDNKYCDDMDGIHFFIM